MIKRVVREGNISFLLSNIMKNEQNSINENRNLNQLVNQGQIKRIKMENKRFEK